MTPRQKYNRKLIYKMLFAFTAIIIVIVAVLSYLFLSWLQGTYEMEMQKRGQSLCRNLAFNSKYEVFIMDKEAIESLLNGIVLEEDIFFAYLEDEKGNIIASKEERSSDSAAAKGNNREDDVFKQIVAVSHDKSHDIHANKVAKITLKNSISILHVSEPIIIEPEEKKGTDESLLLQTGIDTEKSKGKPIMLGYAHIGISLEALNRKVINTRNQIIGLGFVFILVFSVIAWLFSRSIVHPVRLLLEATRKVSQGDLNFHAEVQTLDEIGLLTDSFNLMTEELRKSRDLIEKKNNELLESYMKLEVANKDIVGLNENLEDKIRERTAELDRAYNRLRKRNDELQEITKELERSNIRIREADKLKSEFLANMSHELRTPLNSIIGFSALSLKEDVMQSLPSIRENLEEIHKNGKNLLNIINDILDLSKIEAGRMDLQKESFDIMEIIDHLSLIHI